MVKVTSKERFELEEKYGVPMGENGISRTLKNKYYMCESKYNMKSLNEIRSRNIVK